MNPKDTRTIKKACKLFNFTFSSQGKSKTVTIYFEYASDLIPYIIYFDTITELIYEVNKLIDSFEKDYMIFNLNELENFVALLKEVK